MTVQEVFKQDTHVEPNYFLQKILDFLNNEHKEELGNCVESVTYFIDGGINRIGLMKITQKQITINRIP